MKINTTLHHSKYNDLVMEKVNHQIDRIFPFASIACFLTAVMIFTTDIPLFYSVSNVICGLIFLGFFLLRHKILVSFKLYSGIFIALFMGFTSFLDGGYTSSFILLFALANTLSVLFLTKAFSHMLAGLTTALYLVLWLFNDFCLKGGTYYLDNGKFAMKFFVYLLYIILLNIAVHSIRNLLNENLDKLEKSVEAVNKIAYYDTLTELPNLDYFKHFLEESNTEKGYIVIINLRSLNIINSVYGDLVGDQVIIQTAWLLRSLLEEKEILARVGGNEFALFTPLTDEVSIVKKLHYLTDYYYEHFQIQGMITKVRFFIGYAFSDVSHPLQETYQNARLALTYAKDHEFEGYLPYTETIDDILRQEDLIQSSIEPGLMNHEFIAYYQKKVDSVHNTTVGLEALARWSHSQLGFVSPARFIPIVEKLGLSIKFGEYIVDQVFKDFHILEQKHGSDITTSINISPSYLLYPDFTTYVSQKKKQYNIPENRIIFEITEEIIIQDLEQVSQIIDTLHEEGFLISLDDFGSGYSSINYLTRLSLDELKIDKSFIDQITTNQKARIMLASIINLTDQYDLKIVAEGVETSEQNDLLKGLGCHIIQGYYYSKPEPL